MLLVVVQQSGNISSRRINIVAALHYNMWSNILGLNSDLSQLFQQWPTCKSVRQKIAARVPCISIARFGQQKLPETCQSIDSYLHTVSCFHLHPTELRSTVILDFIPRSSVAWFVSQSGCSMSKSWTHGWNIIYNLMELPWMALPIGKMMNQT